MRGVGGAGGWARKAWSTGLRVMVLLCLGLVVEPRWALAQEPGVVALETGMRLERGWVPGFGGQLRELRVGEESGELLVERAGTVRPLKVGESLLTGDIVRCRRARAELQLGDNERLRLREGAELQVGAERGMLQRLGEVLYEVEGYFSVEYGVVETTVEGTRFSVGEEEGSLVVGVDEGVVRVQRGEEGVRVGAGQVLRVPLSGGTLGQPQRWGRLERGSAVDPGSGGAAGSRWMLGMALGPSLRWGEGAVGGVALGQAELLSSFRVAGPLRAGVEGGLGRGVDGWRIPGNAALEIGFGPVALRAGWGLRFEERAVPCGGERWWLSAGPELGSRAEVPLGRHLRGLMKADVSLGGGPEVGFAMGVGWAG